MFKGKVGLRYHLLFGQERGNNLFDLFYKNLKYIFVLSWMFWKIFFGIFFDSFIGGTMQ